MSAKTFLIQSEGLGKGDDQLGIMLMANFLRLLVKARTNPQVWYSGMPV